MTEFGIQQISEEFPITPDGPIEWSLPTGASILSGILLEQQGDVAAPKVYKCRLEIFAAKQTATSTRYFSILQPGETASSPKGMRTIHICALTLVGGASNTHHLIEYVSSLSE